MTVPPIVSSSQIAYASKQPIAAAPNEPTVPHWDARSHWDVETRHNNQLLRSAVTRGTRSEPTTKPTLQFWRRFFDTGLGLGIGLLGGMVLAVSVEQLLKANPSVDLAGVELLVTQDGFNGADGFGKLPRELGEFELGGRI